MRKYLLNNLKFDDFGRFSNHPSNDNNGIVVLGDSHAMGWGVNDDETFSSILENKILPRKLETKKPNVKTNEIVSIKPITQLA